MNQDDNGITKLGCVNHDCDKCKAQQEKLMPITDDHGQALRPQYRVIEQHGQWQLLYDQHQVGETVRHEFRIQKMTHDIALYPGITLAEAQKRFREKVEADHE